MSNYLPSTTSSGGRTREREAQFPAARTHSHFQGVSSGSSRNMHRGWTGDREMRSGALSTTANFLVQNSGRFLYYKSLAGRLDDDLKEIHRDLTTPHPTGEGRLGTPHTSSRRSPHADATRSSHDDGPLALNAGPRPMPERTERLALGSGPSAGYAPKDGYGRPQLELNSGPRVTALGPGKVRNKFTDGFGGRLQKGGHTPGGALIGPSSGVPFQPSEAPSAKQPGRRAPAGMDPRKRGTWLNHQ